MLYIEIPLDHCNCSDKSKLLYSNRAASNALAKLTSSFSVNLPEDLQERFRVAASKKYGLKQGFVTKGLTEAITDFCDKIDAVSRKKK